jgi:hypothetical protein
MGVLTAEIYEPVNMDEVYKTAHQSFTSGHKNNYKHKYIKIKVTYMNGFPSQINCKLKFVHWHRR